MGNKSDYGYIRSVLYQDVSSQTRVAAADTATVTPITHKDANHQVFVQRILMAVSTDAAQTLTFQDTAGTPVVIGKSKSSPGLGICIVADYGPDGIGLTKATDLQYVISGAGLGCVVNIEAYQKRVGSSAQ